MNGRAGTLVVVATFAATLHAATGAAQIALQPTREPIVTAEHTPWYLGGEPITFAGNIYYPAGPQVFFNRYEMIRSGFYEGIPLYTRTTIEPFSVVFVPVGGGLMQPYERRRAGDVAGTAGSTTPAFPVITPAEQALDPWLALYPQAAAPPTRIAGSIGDISRELTDVTPAPSRGAAVPVPSGAVGAVGGGSPAPVRPWRSALQPKGINAVFVDYQNRRWYSSGPAVEFSATRFVRVGEYHGFPVYGEQGQERTIYVASTVAAEGLLTPYTSR